jgi:hypothetical protein
LFTDVNDKTGEMHEMKDKKGRECVLETMETMLELQLKSVRQMLGKEDVASGPVRRRERKRKSLVDACAEILTEEARPVQIDELVDLLRVRYGRVTDRDSLSSALAKKHRQGVLVRRVAPATFVVRGEGEAAGQRYE